MAMGHVILKEFFIERQVPRFVDYVKKFTDLPFLVTLREKDGAWVPDKFVTAADLGDTSRGRALQDRAGRLAPPAARTSRTARWASATTSQGKGKWNLDLEGVDPALSPVRRRRHRDRRGAAAALRRRARRTTRAAGSTTAACPRPELATAGRRAAGHHRLRPDARPVRRRPRRPARRVADRLRRPRALHPGVAGGDHRRAGRAWPSGSAGSSRRTPRTPAAAR